MYEEEAKMFLEMAERHRPKYAFEEETEEEWRTNSWWSYGGPAPEAY